VRRKDWNVNIALLNPLLNPLGNTLTRTNRTLIEKSIQPSVVQVLAEFSRKLNIFPRMCDEKSWWHICLPSFYLRSSNVRRRPSTHHPTNDPTNKPNNKPTCLIHHTFPLCTTNPLIATGARVTVSVTRCSPSEPQKLGFCHLASPVNKRFPPCNGPRAPRYNHRNSTGLGLARWSR